MTTISNAVLAIYISNTGEVVATEQLDGSPRSIADNQLDRVPGASEASDILQVEVNVHRMNKGSAAPGTRELFAMRTCYDLSGRIVPCF